MSQGLTQEYEFTESQNQTISGLASAMTFIGVLLIVVAVLYSLPGAVCLAFSAIGTLSALASGKPIGPPLAAGLMGVACVVGGALYFFLGRWTTTAASKFSNIVSTRGNDIGNLMIALEQLRKVFSLQRTLFFVMIGMLVLVLIGAVLMGVLGILTHR